MESCDFSRSFITFMTKDRSNNARIQVEAWCVVLDKETGASENYYLVASCKGEDTYGEGCLFLVPGYDFCMVYSAADFMIIRTHANAERDNTTVGDNRGHFLDVHFHIEMVDAKVLESNEEIVQATLDNRILNGRSEIADESGRYNATLEFPIKTMNVNDINNAYQVDTGPILLPDFTSSKGRMVERFQLAFVAYNQEDEAYFVIQEPVPIIEGSSEKVSHYSKVVRMDAQNAVIALQ
ncbi:hypothetical protein ACFL6S_25960 [Candidatus Poribacteria bacterium]